MPPWKRPPDILVSKQSADGAWRSETYGALRDGPSLTPLVMSAILFLPQSGPQGQAALGKGADYLAGFVSDEGKLKVGPRELLFPVYTAASASRVVVLVRRRRANLARPGGMAGLPPRPAAQRSPGLAALGPGVRRLGLLAGRAPQAGAGPAQGTPARVEPGRHGLRAGRPAVGQGAGRRSGLCRGAGVREAVPELQRRPGGRRPEVRRRRVLLHSRRRRAKQGRRGRRSTASAASGSAPTAR